MAHLRLIRGSFSIVSLVAAGAVLAGCRGGGAPPASTESVTSALNESPRAGDFIFEAGNSIVLHSAPLTVSGGDVGARGTGSGPFLSGGVAIDISSGAIVQATHNTIAESIRLNSGVKVGDLQVNRLVNPSSGTHGSVTPVVPLPALPTPAPVTPGTANLTVAGGKTVIASPGQFLTVSLGTGAVLRLSAGSYQMKDLTIGSSGRVEALGAVQIQIANRLNGGSGFFIGPASGTALTAKDVRIEVSGSNGSDGALGSSPKAATLGSNGNIRALVLAPNGTLSFASGIRANGAFLARDIDVGSSSTAYTFEDGFPNGSPTCTAASCDDGNPCTVDGCGSDSVCTHAPAAPGTACSDGNACNGAETCDGAGTCKPGTPVTCTAQDGCHLAGTCDPATGACSNPAAPNGSTCDDGNACTQTDTCQAGVCQGGNAVTCLPLDQCHAAGACDPTTGVCANPAVADGTPCNDGNACTTGDACLVGVCTGRAVSCTALDQCHLAGSCDPATGICSNPNKPDGTTCNDGSACTTSDSCRGGACSGTATVTCAAADQCHSAGTCNPADGTCSNPPVVDGTTCDDGNACTQGDSCQAGACKGGGPLTLDDGNPCTTDSCDPAKGAVHVPVTAGAGCADGLPCSGARVCDGQGACIPVDDGNSCTIDVCNPGTGVSHTPVAAGTPCSSSASCAAQATCDGAGTCSACVLGKLQVLYGEKQIPNAGQITIPAVLTASAGVIIPLTISNVGDGDLVLSGTPNITFSGPNAADFSVPTFPPATLAPGKSETIEVKFVPSLVGTETASLQFNSNDASSPFVISLTGTGLSSDQLNPATNGDPTSETAALCNTREARLMVRTGDIDNLGFKFPAGFDPFSGNNTPVHGFPWAVDPDDPAGTDRIEIGSSFTGGCSDGYCATTSRPANLPQCIVVDYEAPCIDGTVPSSGIIQMFVDDFQPRVWGSSFQVTINGQRAPQIEAGINLLAQTGPIGQLVTFSLTPDELASLQPGAVTICIDDPTTHIGDGYAVDFVKLLLDVYGTDNKGIVTGQVVDSGTGLPISGATVSAGGVVSDTSDANGNYTLVNVPAGFVFLTGSASGYETKGQIVQLANSQTEAVNISMSPNAPPVISSTPVTQVLVGGTYSYKVVATDPDGDSLTWGIPKNEPPGMTVNEFTGQITWTPTKDQIGPWPITVEVNDRRGGVTTQSFTINVGAANQPPMVACQPNVNLVGSSATITISCPVTDDGELNPAPTLTWSSDFKGAQAATLTANGDSASVVLSAPGIYEFALSANDGEFETSSSTIVTLSPSTDPPLIVYAGTDQAITAMTTTLVGTTVGGGGPLSVTWSQLDGPAPVQIATPLALSTAATFSTVGTYDFALSATDGISTVNDTVAVVVVPPTGAQSNGTQGWIGSPLSQTTVNGLVPITVAPGVTVVAGTVSYWPATNQSAAQVLNAVAQGGPGATLATLDTTTLRNGSYIIDLNATDSLGNALESDILITVDGEYKPGRKVVEVTDFTVPIAGMPITVGRRYDSLEKDQVGDFGNGWSLTVGHPDLQVDQGNNVTITLPGGRRATFQFELVPVVAGPVVIEFFGTPRYVPAQGVLGTLTSDGCSLLSIGFSDSGPTCFGVIDPSELQYAPTTYRYTDPYGTVYTMGADGSLQSIQDRNNNVLTFTAGGIVSTPSGQTVTFTRDGQGRITKILTPVQYEYDYAYDENGNLSSAKQPPQGTFNQISTYTYDNAHLLLTTVDPAGHQESSTYDDAGRLASSTDGMGNVTKYAYDVAGHTTTTTYPDTGVMTQAFDDNGLLLSQTDQLGRTTTHVYDVNRAEIKKTNALGESTTYTYDANGNQTSSTNALGETTTASYNALSAPLTRTDPIGNTMTVAYDQNGSPTSVRDGMGPLVTVTSSQQGQPLSLTDAAGGTILFSYDFAGNLAGRIDRLGRQTAFAFDGMGRKTAMVDPRGGMTSYTYDEDGDLTFTQNPMGFGPLVRYDAARNVQQIQDVNGSVTRSDEFSYDADNHLVTTHHDGDGSEIHQTSDFRGNVLTRTDEAGNTTRYAYDLAGQLVQTTYADGTFTAQTYDALGRLQSKTDERGNTTTYTYQAGCDCSDRVTSVTDPLGRTTSMTYDAMGHKTSTTDANGHKTSFVYDLRGHLIETDYADGTATHDTYDAVGRRTASADQTGATTHFGYDAEGELTSVTDPLGNVTQYAYDSNGNLTSVTDANNHVTTFAYDAANRKVSRTLPLGMTETFGYDGDDNITSHTDFRGKTTIYSYDGRRKGGRLVSKVPDPTLAEPTISYQYNATGTRFAMTDASGTTTYGYDVRNRLLKKATPEGTLTYTYDASGNVASIDSSNTNGTSVAYAWDPANELSTVRDNRLGGNTTVAYTSTGQSASVEQPNGVVAAYVYDALDRVTSTAWTGGGGAAIASWAYNYNQRGQRLSSTDAAGRAATYGYDVAARLTSETVTGDPGGQSANGALTYTLDAVGNRVSRASTLGPLGTQQFEYDANDQLTSEGYDTNGNAISSDGHVYTFDFENRLVSKDGGSVRVVYDGDGNRVSKTVGGVTTEYLVDELNPTGYLQVMDEVSGGAVQVRYTFGNMLVSETRQASATPVVSFYGYDAHRNVTFLSDASGLVTDTYTYDGWGNLIGRTGTTPNTRLYASEELDADLGFINLRARQYNPGEGRFESADSRFGNRLKPGTENRYLYAHGDPINWLDPSGHVEAAEVALFLAAVAVPIVIATAYEPHHDNFYKWCIAAGSIGVGYTALDVAAIIASGPVGIAAVAGAAVALTLLCIAVDIDMYRGDGGGGGGGGE